MIKNSLNLLENGHKSLYIVEGDWITFNYIQTYKWLKNDYKWLKVTERMIKKGENEQK